LKRVGKGIKEKCIIGRTTDNKDFSLWEEQWVCKPIPSLELLYHKLQCKKHPPGMFSR